jgi:hypothetical protein
MVLPHDCRIGRTRRARDIPDLYPGLRRATMWRGLTWRQAAASWTRPGKERPGARIRSAWRVSCAHRVESRSCGSKNRRETPHRCLTRHGRTGHGGFRAELQLIPSTASSVGHTDWRQRPGCRHDRRQRHGGPGRDGRSGRCRPKRTGIDQTIAAARGQVVVGEPSRRRLLV